ncbi:D-alanyl-D-alanine carboxypeptidase/D-alanyl-D-alanine-endopeptidase [uncultured Friedmanniella sp.]|uniref:D-alanyl-D-alanine carboxypeptidase/D-alanyl-D-alanine endopeptidase n=1 Tax=uncultured Friedmanniella sp. TaxID=335381 RepID=UPI0035C9FE8B
MSALSGVRRFGIALVAMLVVAGVVVGSVTGFFRATAEHGLYASGLWVDGGASTISPGALDAPATPRRSTTPSPRATADDLPSPVLAAAGKSRVASAAKVAAQVRAVSIAGMGGSYSGEVADLSTGKVLYSHRASTPYIPASTMKLLTTTAALSLLGPEHEFTTSVVRSGKHRVVLVGGGDPYLGAKADPEHPGRASLAALATTSAAELRRAGTTKVSLRYDASLFSGPAWNSHWPDTYADQVTPVSALWADEGRATGGSPGPRVSNPALDAATTFAKALKRHGVSVTSVSAGRAPKSATRVAQVRSAPLEQIVQQLLLASDNDAAEVLFRQVALASHHAGSSAAGVRAVKARLTKLGVWDSSATINDGSGLARQTKVPADLLVAVLRAAASPTHPELRGVLTGLPVAGVEGSLRRRYGDDDTEVGRGVVRAKTGTLSEVHALAGYLRTADGSQLAFAFVVNDAKNDYVAQVWLDRVGAALSRCGC